MLLFVNNYFFYLPIDIYKNRNLGYKQALLDYGIEINKDYILETKSSLSEGANSVKQLLKLKQKPEAIFSSSGSLCPPYPAISHISKLKNLN